MFFGYFLAFSLRMLLVSRWMVSCVAAMVLHVPGMDGGVMPPTSMQGVTALPLHVLWFRLFAVMFVMDVGPCSIMAIHGNGVPQRVSGGELYCKLLLVWASKNISRVAK